jgi:hypothetical protein
MTSKNKNKNFKKKWLPLRSRIGYTSISRMNVNGAFITPFNTPFN